MFLMRRGTILAAAIGLIASCESSGRVSDGVDRTSHPLTGATRAAYRAIACVRVSPSDSVDENADLLDGALQSSFGIGYVDVAARVGDVGGVRREAWVNASGAACAVFTEASGLVRVRCDEGPTIDSLPAVDERAARDVAEQLVSVAGMRAYPNLDASSPLQRHVRSGVGDRVRGVLHEELHEYGFVFHEVVDDARVADSGIRIGVDRRGRITSVLFSALRCVPSDETRVSGISDSALEAEAHAFASRRSARFEVIGLPVEAYFPEFESSMARVLPRFGRRWTPMSADGLSASRSRFVAIGATSETVPPIVLGDPADDGASLGDIR